MSVFDRFLNSIKLNDDDDLDDDEYFDDDDSGLDDSRPSRRFITRDEDEDDFIEEEEQIKPIRRQEPPQAPVKGFRKARAQAPRETKVSAFRPRRNQEEPVETNNFSVCVIRPKSMEDALQIAQMLIAHCTIILNLEGLDLDVSQRIFDFASGACCASRGQLDKISNYIFVLTPHDVDITGEFQQILTGTFDPDLDLSDDL